MSMYMFAQSTHYAMNFYFVSCCCFVPPLHQDIQSPSNRKSLKMMGLKLLIFMASMCSNMGWIRFCPCADFLFCIGPSMSLNFYTSFVVTYSKVPLIVILLSYQEYHHKSSAVIQVCTMLSSTHHHWDLFSLLRLA